MNELITVNLGNSSISLVRFRGDEIVSRVKMGYKERGVWKKVSSFINPEAGLGVCSVNKKSEKRLRELLRGRRGIFYISYKNRLNFANKYKDPKLLGNDRIANLAGVSGLIKGPCIIVDFGTAITVDVLTKCREFAGGLIFPGEFLMYESLGETSLLPVITGRGKERFPGLITEECISSGVKALLESGISGIIRKIKERIRKRVTVIYTGGGAEYFAEGKCVTLLPDLTHLGIKTLYYKNK